MGRRIELPSLPAGQPQEQLQALYHYLYQMAEALNNNLAEIGNGDFTDQEMIVVREIVGENQEYGAGMAEAETLKSLIIKTAQLIKSEIDRYNMKLTGTYEAEGKLGRYVRKTRLDVDVTPTGITQNYTFQDIIQGLKTYEVNAKNYIKTGLLRTVNQIPVYGVAIGKDVVTFSNDGTETYNDGNKVAELTADELSFWQGGNKVASYSGSGVAFYQNNKKTAELGANEIALYNNNTKKVSVGNNSTSIYNETYVTNEIYIQKAGEQDLGVRDRLISLTDGLGNTYTKTETASLIQTEMTTALGDYYTKTETATEISTYVGNHAYGIQSGIVINASGIEVSGAKYVKIKSGGSFSVDSGNFSIDTSGNVTLTGTISAGAGSTIGGWTLGAKRMSSGSGTGYVAMDSDTSDTYAIWAGDGTAGSAPFRVKRDGTVYLTSLIAVGENGTESTVNLRTAGLWKLGYQTVKSLTQDNGYCTSMTFSSSVSGVATVNFRDAASLRNEGWSAAYVKCGNTITGATLEIKRPGSAYGTQVSDNYKITGLSAYSRAGEIAYTYSGGQYVSFRIPNDCKTGTARITYDF